MSTFITLILLWRHIWLTNKIGIENWKLSKCIFWNLEQKMDLQLDQGLAVLQTNFFSRGFGTIFPLFLNFIFYTSYYMNELKHFRIIHIIRSALNWNCQKNMSHIFYVKLYQNWILFWLTIPLKDLRRHFSFGDSKSKALFLF